MADVITKAELARELGVSRPRVTELCQAGLPVRPNGKLNRMQALNWVKAECRSVPRWLVGEHEAKEKGEGPGRGY